jgi:hypothetical protein
LIPTFCKKCGNNLPDSAKFCDKCGALQIRADTSSTTSYYEETNKLESGSSKVRKYCIIGMVGIFALVIIAAVFFYVTLGTASLISNSQVSSNPFPTTLSSTNTPSQQQRWISATIKKYILNPGDTVSIEGVVSGNNDPVILSVFTLEDTNVHDFSRPLLTDSIAPSSDGKYSFNFSINSQNIPLGSYVIILKLITGETTKLQFLVEAQ